MKLSDFELNAYLKNSAGNSGSEKSVADMVLSDRLKDEKKMVKPFNPKRI